MHRLALRVMLCAALLTTAISPPEPATAQPAPATPRAIVLVTVDSLPASSVALTSQPTRDPGRTFSEMAQGGAIFHRAYATSSWTAPSMASVFTGVYPSSHGVVSGTFAPDFQSVVGQPSLPREFTTLAERLKAAGYTTVGVPSSRHFEDWLGFAQGFDYYAQAPSASAGKTNSQVTELLAEAYGPNWKSAWRSKRTFLWIHYVDPTIPYEAREPWIHRFAPLYAKQPELYPAGARKSELRELLERPKRRGQIGRAQKVGLINPLHQSEVAFVDDHFGKLAQTLGLDAPDVALVLLGTHGEELGHHGGVGHGTTLFEEVVRVPLFFRWPDGIEERQVFEEPVSLLDVYPTLAQLSGGDVPWGLHGRSLTSALRGGAAPVDRQLLLQATPQELAARPLTALIEGQWKLIVRDERGPDRESHFLYDLGSDRRERTNLNLQQQALLQSLRESLTARLSDLPPPPGTPRDEAEEVPELRTD